MIGMSKIESRLLRDSPLRRSLRKVSIMKPIPLTNEEMSFLRYCMENQTSGGTGPDFSWRKYSDLWSKLGGVLVVGQYGYYRYEDPAPIAMNPYPGAPGYDEWKKKQEEEREILNREAENRLEASRKDQDGQQSLG